MNELKNYVTSLKQEAAKTKAVKMVLTEFNLPQPLTYQGAISFSAEEGVQPNKNLPVLNPLQAYPLQSYRFIGTLSHDNQIWAYIMGPGNLVYQIKKGDLLSDQYGRIIEIKPDRLHILFQDKKFQRNVTMQLKEQH